MTKIRNNKNIENISKILNNNNSDNFYRNNKYSNSDKIASDFKLLVNLIINLLIYIILFIPYIIIFIFSVLFNNKKAKSKYFEKIFLEPLKIIEIIIKWLFQSPISTYLIIFMIFMYIIEIFYLQNYPDLLKNIMTHQMHIFNGNFYSIFTSIFLHANLLHLITNCIALLIFGRIVENQFKTKTLFIFLISGILSNFISNMISYYMGNFYYSLGASGAIAGLIILAILISPFTFTSFFVIPLPIFIIGWILIAIDVTQLTNYNSTTNHLAHLGGYATLILLLFFFEFKNRKKVINGLIINIVLLMILYLSFKFIEVNFLIDNILNLKQVIIK